MGGPVARSGKGKLGDDCDEDGPAQTPTVLSYEMFVFCFVIALFGFVSGIVICNMIEFIPGFQMRVNRVDELFGLDFCEHGINPGNHLDFQKLEELDSKFSRTLS